MQASHHAIAAHRLVVLAEVNTVSQDWGNLLFKLSLAEALEEVAASITEEAWLNNEDAFNIRFDYIHNINDDTVILVIPTIFYRFFYQTINIFLYIIIDIFTG